MSIYDEIKERVEQLGDQDDDFDCDDWIARIGDSVDDAADLIGAEDATDAQFRSRLLDVAAMVVAAVEALDMVKRR